MVARLLFAPTTFPITPTTALSFSSSIVTAGSSRFTCPALMASITACGSAFESTFSPTDKAVLGLTFLMTCCICSVSVQSCSSPNVSKRKIDSPSVLVCDSPCEAAEIRIATEMVAVEKINRNMAYFSSRPCDPSVPMQLDAEGRRIQPESCRALSARQLICNCYEEWLVRSVAFVTVVEKRGDGPTNRYFCNTQVNMPGSKIPEIWVLLL